MPEHNRTVTVRTILSLIMIAAPANAQEPSQRGRLHIVWDVDGGASAREHFIVDNAGRALRLRVADGVASDRLLPIDRSMVDVRTTGLRDGVVPSATLLDAVAVGPGMLSNAASGSTEYNFITLLCQFADDLYEPFTPGDVGRVHGSEYPGVRNFFAELAWDDRVMSGSTVSNWYRLPSVRSAYVKPNGTDFGALARDCTAAADADFHFPDYYGINLQFSGALGVRPVEPYDTLSYGGSWTLTLDGVSRSWGMTWLSAGHVSNYVVLTHEIGHAIGWPHSSGDYGNEYDSYWDIMSRGYIRYEPPYGWLGIHTIAQHKDAAGWVPEERRWTPAAGTFETAVITQTALPAEDGYLMARVPTGSNSHYTVELRRAAGHDKPLPANAIVLHHVLFDRAVVVDVDDNGDPNDPAAQWIPGESFQDSIAGVTVDIGDQSKFGFEVRITRGWRLDLAVSGNGRVVGTAASPIECDSACVLVQTQRGVAFTLEPVPAEGWRFVEWRGACAGSANCFGTLNGNRHVEAVFALGPIVRTDAVPSGIMGADYSGSLTVDGAASADWTVVQGTLPPGVALEPATGLISGVPARAGTFDLVVEVNTSEGKLAAPVSISVEKPVLALQKVIDHLFGRRVLTNDEVRFLDLLGNSNGKLDVGDVRQWLIDAAQLTATERSAAAALLRTDASIP